MDAREATVEVKKYFENVKGSQPIAFDVEHVELKDDVWTVRCSFFPSPIESRIVYEVKVNDKDKKILIVKSIPAKQS